MTSSTVSYGLAVEAIQFKAVKLSQELSCETKRKYSLHGFLVKVRSC